MTTYRVNAIDGCLGEGMLMLLSHGRELSEPKIGWGWVFRDGDGTRWFSRRTKTGSSATELPPAKPVPHSQQGE